MNPSNADDVLSTIASEHTDHEERTEALDELASVLDWAEGLVATLERVKEAWEELTDLLDDPEHDPDDAAAVLSDLRDHADEAAGLVQS